jgi:2-methylcitrate dehydratase PrpD
MGLLDRELGPDQFAPERYDEARVRALMDRVMCVHDPDLDAEYPARWPAWVEVRTTDGGQYRERVDHPRGDPENPLGVAELAAKFAQLTRHCYDDDRRAALETAISAMPDDDALATILRRA